jgi:hypothetical protein
MQVEIDAAEYEQFKQFRAAMHSDPPPPESHQASPTDVPPAPEANLFLATGDGAASARAPNPGPTGAMESDDEVDWTDARALNASMGVNPFDRAAVQRRRQEVREYLGRYGKVLNVAWTKWDPAEWQAMERTASMEFAARRAYRSTTTTGIMKSLCEVNHRNEQQARRTAAGIVPIPRVTRPVGVTRRRRAARSPRPSLRRPTRSAQVVPGSLGASSPPHEADTPAPPPPAWVCLLLAFCPA